MKIQLITSSQGFIFLTPIINSNSQMEWSGEPLKCLTLMERPLKYRKFLGQGHLRPIPLKLRQTQLDLRPI